MKKIEMCAFQIISEVGMAKSLLMESLSDSRIGNYDEANSKIEKAEKFILKAEESHLGAISQEANGENIQLSLLLMHAEDQLMSTLLLKDMSKEFVLLYEKVNKNI